MAVLTGLTAVLTRASRRWWLVVLLVGLNVVNVYVLFGLEARFTVLTGLPTFDTQNDLTADVLRAQLPAYQGAARGAYLLFLGYDFVFPLLAGLMVAVLVTLFLRLNRQPIAARLLLGGVPALLLLGTLWDWLENVGFAGVLATGGAGVWVGGALLFKQLKLVWLAGSGLALVGALVWLLVDRVMGVRQAGPRAAK